MNKSESKYFNTAARMDEAFLGLLAKKDFAYITVKEICENAGVNRSTFYLHYETVSDLLSESVEYMNGKFLNYIKPDSKEIVLRLKDCLLEELYLITPEYLTPYLNYIKENKRLFRTAVENAGTLRLSEIYDKMFAYVFTPILERFQVPEQDRKYIMAFYISGLIAIITEWIKQDCDDSVDFLISVMQKCVMRYEQNEGNK
ncbi:MAG: TetR/AcrR family transcriptional regulator C-terminal domain-containing protein [Eubacterium sp.]